MQSNRVCADQVLGNVANQFGRGGRSRRSGNRFRLLGLETLERRCLLTNLIFTADDAPAAGATNDGTPDGFLIAVNEAAVDIFINNESVLSTTIADVDSITINGSSDNDGVLIDDSSGSLPFDVSVNGGGNDDAAFLLGSGSFGDSITVRANGSRAEAVRDNLGTFVFGLDNVEFFTIDLGGGDDSLEVSDLDGTGLRQLTPSLGAGNDRLIFGDQAVLGTEQVGTADGGDGEDTIDYRAYATDVSVDLVAGTATGTSGISNFEKVIDNTVANRPPIADAGPNRTVDRGTIVFLDGSGSRDPDGDPISFRWTIVSAPLESNVALSDNSASPAFGADQIGTYVFQLVVNDGKTDSLADTVSIEVTAPANSSALNLTADDSSGSADDGQPDFFSISLDDTLTVQVNNITVFNDDPNLVDQIIIGGSGDDDLLTVSNLPDIDITFDGGGGLNSIVVAGSTGNDSIVVDLHGTGTVDITGEGPSLFNLNIENIDEITVNGSMGDDTIRASGGDGEVDITLSGNRGSDLLEASRATSGLRGLGGAGTDTLLGGDGDDTLLGGSSDDVVDGNGGADVILGGPGGDFLRGDNGNDSIAAGAGDDTVSGERGDDSVNGQGGNDVLSGNAGSDILRGSSGNDLVRGGSGKDDIRDPRGTNSLLGGSGDDTIVGGRDSDTIRGGAGNDVLRGGGNIDLLRGDFGNDTIIGDGGSDTLRGGAGNDALFGRQGDDVLGGDRGVDVVNGGPGNNILLRDPDVPQPNPQGTQLLDQILESGILEIFTRTRRARRNQ